MQRTLLIIKPDAMERNLIGRILAQIEAEGFRIVEARTHSLTQEEAGTFYAEHKERPFFPDLVGYMTSGPVMLVCLEREDAIKHLRSVVGATNPDEATSGTVRQRFGVDKQRNSVHASDSPESAVRELSLLFSKELAEVT
jgi:nucleoside-diphosphate kinase